MLHQLCLPQFFFNYLLNDWKHQFKELSKCHRLFFATWTWLSVVILKNESSYKDGLFLTNSASKNDLVQMYNVVCAEHTYVKVLTSSTYENEASKSILHNFT